MPLVTKGRNRREPEFVLFFEASYRADKKGDLTLFKCSTDFNQSTPE